MPATTNSSPACPGAPGGRYSGSGDKSLAALALLLALGRAPALAADFNIPCANFVGDTAALIKAIVDARTTPDPADTIILGENCTYTLKERYAQDREDRGLPSITTDITIKGNGSTITRDSKDTFGILIVYFGKLTLQETTVSGGNTTGLFYDLGGGIANYSGTLTLNRSTVSGNTASYGGGVDNGGRNKYSPGTAFLTDSTVSGNSANANGGGVNNPYTMTLTDSTVSGNSANGTGGGVGNVGTMTLTNSTVSGNSAYGGGGVYNHSGTVTLTNSTVSGNIANDTGGGVVNGSGTAILTNSTVSGNSAESSRGGGVYNHSGTVTLTNSTVSGNSAFYDGGGVNNYLGTVTLTNSTVSGNSAFLAAGGVYNGSGAVTLTRTLISGNTAPADVEVFNFSGTVTAANYNLFGHDGLTNLMAFSGFAPSGSDITATSDCTPGPGCFPKALAKILAPLANNGGPTETHALLAGSPAINAAGLGCPPPKTDQRGVLRPQGPACDIGAFELRPPGR